MTRLAIHLPGCCQQQSPCSAHPISTGKSLLLHDLHIDLLHIHLLIELGRKLGALEELRVHTGRHGRGSGSVAGGVLGSC